MAMNPFALLKAKERMNMFFQAHPRMQPFIMAVKDDMRPGTVIEITVKTEEGKTTTSNIKLTEEDIETIHILGNIKD